MTWIPARLKRLAARRASGRCEYCGLAQMSQEATFHTDHIKPSSRGGKTELRNLAFACVSCSLRKQARRSALDPLTGSRAHLFHPRRQRWKDHFEWDGPVVVGLTPVGRATVKCLSMNRPIMVLIRIEETVRGRHPPS